MPPPQKKNPQPHRCDNLKTRIAHLCVRYNAFVNSKNLRSRHQTTDSLAACISSCEGVTRAQFRQLIHSWTFKALKAKELRFFATSGRAYRLMQRHSRAGRICRLQLYCDPEMFLAWCAQVLLIRITQMDTRALSVVVLNYGVGETYNCISTCCKYEILIST